MRKALWTWIHWNMPFGLLHCLPEHIEVLAGYLVTKVSTRAINAGHAGQLGVEPIAHAPQGTGNAQYATSNIIRMLLWRND